MSESNEIRTMRQMAWERAKGELRSMLVSYWPTYTHGNKDESNYERMRVAIEQFVEHVEREGLQE